jgi:hypothetical protein
MQHTHQFTNGRRSIKTINRTAVTSATPDIVYALLLDRPTWPSWSPLESFEHESDGIDGPNSLGAIGTFLTGRTHSREELVELVPQRRLSYALLSGLPLRNYQGTVDIDAQRNRTIIRWRSTFIAPFGTGWAFRYGLGRFIGKTVAGLARAADAAMAARTDTADPSDRQSDSALSGVRP